MNEQDANFEDAAYQLDMRYDPLTTMDRIKQELDQIRLKAEEKAKAKAEAMARAEEEASTKDTEENEA